MSDGTYSVRDALAMQAVKNREDYLTHEEKQARAEVLNFVVMQLLGGAADAAFRASVKTISTEPGFDVVALQMESRKNIQLRLLLATAHLKIVDAMTTIIDHIENEIPSREPFALYLYEVLRRSAIALKTVDLNSDLSFDAISEEWKKQIKLRLVDPDEEEEDDHEGSVEK